MCVKELGHDKFRQCLVRFLAQNHYPIQFHIVKAGFSYKYLNNWQYNYALVFVCLIFTSQIMLYFTVVLSFFVDLNLTFSIHSLQQNTKTKAI